MRRERDDTGGNDAGDGIGPEVMTATRAVIGAALLIDLINTRRPGSRGTLRRSLPAGPTI